MTSRWIAALAAASMGGPHPLGSGHARSLCVAER